MGSASKHARWLEYTVTESCAGQTVQAILTGPMGISRRMLQKLTRNKGILINNKPAFLKRIVKTGDLLKAKIAFAETENLEPEAIALQVVYEDADLLILDKPAGLAVHPTQPGQTGTLAHGVAYHLQQQGLATKVRPVHRLDLNTSGLIIFAKNQRAHGQLDLQLRNHLIQREYLAIVEGLIDATELTIDLPIGRLNGHATKRIVTPKGEPAVTHLQVAAHLKAATLLMLRLETGRTHQIRVHLSHLGHPLWGDYLYGAKQQALISRQALHAFRLGLTHPTTGQAMSFDAPLPEELVQLRRQLTP